MNKKQIIAKMARDLGMLKIAYTQSADTLVAVGMTVSCVDASIQSPMGGVDGSVSPFLGIGVANPGKIKIKGAAGENTLAAIFTTEDNMKVFGLACGFANNVVVEAGDTTTQLAEIAGQVDLLGMGQ